MIYQLVVALSVAATASAALYSEDHTQQKSLWENFKIEHGKNYATFEEESRRFYLFVENLKVADQRNADEKKAGGSAVHGVTKFSDLSQVEFETRYLTSDPSMRNANRTVRKDLPVPKLTGGLVDWTTSANPRNAPMTSAVKDQGYCGSCWAFSATEQIESDALLVGKTAILSPEQITQCDKTSGGCDGGWTEHAYNYVVKAGGMETDADYPYTSYQGVTGRCNEDSSKFVLGITGYTAVGSEADMASYVQSTGPLSVCVDAAKWNSYKGGIVTSCGNRVDHCVQAVGVDTSSYWLVRNSWGLSWGEQGYIRLQYGSGMCAIDSDPTYTTIA